MTHSTRKASLTKTHRHELGNRITIAASGRAQNHALTVIYHVDSASRHASSHLCHQAHEAILLKSLLAQHARSDPVIFPSY